MADKDYIPLSDGEFDGFQGNFVDYVVANLAGVLSPSQIAELVAQRAEWEAAAPAYELARAAARTAAERKREARQALRHGIRAAASIIQSDPSVGDDVRVSLRITVRDRVRTRVAVPESTPILKARLAAQAILLSIIDGEGKTRRKPKGVVGCQIFVDIGGATPSDRESFRYLGMATDGRFQATFTGEEIGKFAHFYGRWMNTRGELGPYGPTLTVVVPN